MAVNGYCDPPRQLLLGKHDILASQTNVCTASRKILLNLKMFMNFNIPTEISRAWDKLYSYIGGTKKQSLGEREYKSTRKRKTL